MGMTLRQSLKPVEAKMRKKFQVQFKIGDFFLQKYVDYHFH